MLHQIPPSAPVELSDTQLQIATDTWDLCQVLTCASWIEGFATSVWEVLVATSINPSSLGYVPQGSDAEAREILERLDANARAAGGFLTGDLPALVNLHYSLRDGYIRETDLDDARESYVASHVQWHTLEEMAELTGLTLPS